MGLRLTDTHFVYWRLLVYNTPKDIARGKKMLYKKVEVNSDSLVVTNIFVFNFWHCGVIKVGLCKMTYTCSMKVWIRFESLLIFSM